MGGADEYVLVDEAVAAVARSTLVAFDFLSAGTVTMDRLSDHDLSPLAHDLHGRPWPPARAKGGHPRHPVRLRHPTCASAHAAIRILLRVAIGLMRRYNPYARRFRSGGTRHGLVDCGNVGLTPSKIVDAFERTETGGRPHRRRPAPCRSPSAATAPVTVPVARAVGKKHPRMAAFTSMRTPPPTPGADERSAASSPRRRGGLVDPEFSWRRHPQHDHGAQASCPP